jgi:hypothetical protein
MISKILLGYLGQFKKLFGKPFIEMIRFGIGNFYAPRVGMFRIDKHVPVPGNRRGGNGQAEAFV